MLKAGNGSGAGRDGERADRPVASPEQSVVAKRRHDMAYSWRDEFLSGQANIANVGPIPFCTKAYGWLDASVSYRFNEYFSLSVERANLLQTERLSYYRRETLPQNIYINDRQIRVYATYRV